MSLGVIELVVFRGKEGVTREAMTAAALSITPILKDMPGFLGREFAATADGQYADIVRWTDMRSAKQAAGEGHANPRLRSLLLVDR